jgi:tetratricopeptide (TPR) repeat protein
MRADVLSGWGSELAVSDYDVFVSYAHEDSAAVRPLVDALVAQGLRVWFDVDTIETHESITRSVREGVAMSKVLIAYYSATYPTRRACQWELTAAFLAAQRAGEEPSSRVLVINPERAQDGGPQTAHIRPIELVDAVFAIASGEEDAAAWAKEAERIADVVAGCASVLGAGERRLSRQLGLRLVDTAGFVGRLSDLWDIHSALSAADAVQITAAAGGDVAQLAGMGGVGKSLLAEEYALRFAAAYPGGVFWLHGADAGDPDTLPTEVEREATRDAQFRKVAAELGLSSAGLSAAEIYGALSRELERSDRSLWVVDGLAVGLRAEEARRWLAPHPNARTLITTRSRKYELGRRVVLERLTPAEGYALLTSQRSPRNERERVQALGIVEDLDGHALALGVAAHALRAVAGMSTFGQYRDALALQADDELEFAAQLEPELPNGHEPNIAVTLLRSIRHLEDAGQNILRIASLLAPAPMPVTLLRDVVAEADSLSTGQALRRVALGVEEAHGLCLSDTDGPLGERVSVHTLVTRTMRFRDVNSKRRRELRHAATAALLKPLADVEDRDTHEEIADLIAHARELIRNTLIYAEKGVEISRSFVPLLVSVAGYDEARGDYEVSVDLWRVVVDVAAQSGASDEFMQLVRSRLATALQSLGKASEASELLEKMVESRSGDADAVNDELIDLRCRQALALLSGGEVDRGIELQQEILEWFAEGYGENHFETLRTMNHFAFLRVQFAGDVHLASSMVVQLESLEKHALVCGEDHPETLKMKHYFACTLKRRGDLRAARALFKRVLEERLERREDEALDTYLTRFQLAEVMSLEGETEPAVELLEYVIESGGDALGEKHQVVRGAEDLLAQIVDESVSTDAPGVSEESSDSTSQRADHNETTPPEGARALGRNDPCWCGSGVKFKRCHGA